VLLIVDYKISIGDPNYSLMQTIAKLKEAILEAYRHYGSEQEEIWVVAHSITRAE
jgi:hypothetical protein